VYAIGRLLHCLVVGVQLTSYIQFLSFSLILAISAAILTVRVIPRVLKLVSKRIGAQSAFYTSLLTETFAEGPNDSPHGDVPENRNYGSFSQSNNTIREDSGKAVLITVTRSGSERLRVAVEALAVTSRASLAVVALNICAISDEWKDDSPYVPWILLAFWSYALILVAFRLLIARGRSISTGGLWYHSTIIYLFAFSLSLISLNGAVLYPFSNASQKYYLADTALCTILVVLNFTAKFRDSPARLYITPDGRKPSPEPVSSLYQLLSFSWVQPMIWQGYKVPLDMEDVWELREDDHAFHVLNKFTKLPINHSLLNRLAMHFKWEFGISILWGLLYASFNVAPALLLKQILEYIEDPSVFPRHVAWLYVVLFLIFGIFVNISGAQANYIGRRLAIQMQALIVGEIYSKALRRKAVAGGDSTLGQKNQNSSSTTEADPDEATENESGKANIGAIINLMAVDTWKISDACAYIHCILSGFSIILVIVIVLCHLLSWSGFVGACALTMLGPLNYWIAIQEGDVQDFLMSITDKRVEKTNELLQAIRIIKYFAWEEKFVNNILKIRKEELRALRKRYLIWACGSAIYNFSPMVLTIVSFGCYTVIQGKHLTAPVAFTSLTLFNLLKSPMDDLAESIGEIVQAKVSIDRIEQFLSEEETAKYEQLSEINTRGPQSPYIGIERGSFSWMGSSKSFAAATTGALANVKDFKLRDINVSFELGKLNVIIGPLEVVKPLY
jgi:ABC-type multidrug transport system fused ATPase/permease subunit